MSGAAYAVPKNEFRLYMDTPSTILSGTPYAKTKKALK
jgi:hypothetical protein